MKRFATILLALVMILSLTVGAAAAEVTKVEGVYGDASITVTLPTIPEGTTANNTYKIYKVFDATTSGGNISYTLVDGKTEAPSGFTVDEQGNVSYAGGDASTLSAADIAAIAGYVTESDLVATVTTTAADTSFTVSGLPYGYYYITTTTGSLVTVDSTNPNATVNDKNTVPELEKTLEDLDENGKKAISEVGSKVEYTVTITVGAGAKGYVFHDKMSTGLTYNNDVAVTVDNKPVDEANYDKTTAEGDTITIKFTDAYLATLAENTQIVITYSATVNSDALTEDPANNTAWLDYGEGNKTVTDSTEVYNAKISVKKTDGNGEALAGAGFVLKNSAGKYYTLVENKIVWVDSIDDADEHVSDAEGKVTPFTGLANGTYTLVEKTVPAGYNKAADQTITIENGNVTVGNLSQNVTVINQSGSELPSTGGVGTTMFYLFGGILVLASVVLLVTKKRMTNMQ